MTDAERWIADGARLVFEEAGHTHPPGAIDELSDDSSPGLILCNVWRFPDQSVVVCWHTGEWEYTIGRAHAGTPPVRPRPTASRRIVRTRT